MTSVVHLLCVDNITTAEEVVEEQASVSTLHFTLVLMVQQHSPLTCSHLDCKQLPHTITQSEGAFETSHSIPFITKLACT